ncbi:hypothetical protein RSAG8_13197, partial [Rhizoctonia solani AG-8 WAC10335]
MPPNHPRSKKRPANANASSQPHSDVEVAVDETPVALYDFPPNNVRSQEHVSGHHKSCSTEHNVQYHAYSVQYFQECTQQKSNDTCARNRSLHSDDEPRCNNKSPQHEGSNSSGAEAVPIPRQCRHSRTIRLKLSASPEPTINKPEQPTQASDDSQYTYEYETLTHEGPVQYAKEAFNLDVEGCNTHSILDLLRLTRAEQAPQVGPSWCLPSIVMLPPTPLGVGGGWSQSVVGSKRRGSQALIPSNDEGAGKPRRKVTVEDVEDVDAFKPHGKVVPGNKLMVEEDTATEPETDDEPAQATDSSARRAAEYIMSGCTSGPACPATVIDSQLSNASLESLGGPPYQRRPDSCSQPDIAIPPELAKKLTNWSSLPLHGPTHTRLHSEIILHYLTNIGGIYMAQ